MKTLGQLNGRVDEHHVHPNNASQKSVNLQTGDLLPLICTTVATDGMLYQVQVFLL